MPPESDSVAHELRSQIRGGVFDSEDDLARYSCDESIFAIRPRVVLAPVDEEDVRTAVCVARNEGLPITCRGGGTGVAGQSIGSGIVLDFSVHMNKLLDVTADEAIAEPGILLDDLNASLARHNRRFAPDPSSHARCSLGGMVNTNASGPRAFRYGDTRRHIAELRLVLADGSVVRSSDIEPRFRELTETVRRDSDLVAESSPKTRKNSSGYFLGSLLQDPADFTKLLVGSEGTLGVVTGIRVKTIPTARSTVVAVFAYSSIQDAIEALPKIRALDPVAIELMDHHILGALRGVSGPFIETLGLKEAACSLWVEWENGLPCDVVREPAFLVRHPEDQAYLWKLRSDASKWLHAQGGARMPLRCVEDTIVPVERLTEYVAALREIFLRHDCDGALFGHVGDGHIHANPMIDVTAPGLAGRIEKLMDEVYTLVEKTGGSITGEHGDGLMRRKYVERQWREVLPLFRKVKETFDPQGILNPDKKLPTSDTTLPAFRDFAAWKRT